MGYNRDTQWTKYWIMDLIDESKPALSVMADVIRLLRIDKKRMLEEAQKEFAGATSLMEWMVRTHDPARGRVVFSERAALSTTGQRNQLLRDLQPGQCVGGVITNITDFGVFVDLGGFEGLIHVSELSWGRVRHPIDMVNIGDRITAYVMQIDKERARIALSMKRLCSNPWESADQRYQPGQVVNAVITSVVSFGAFARLEEGLDGLIHISEMGLDTITDLEEVVQEGQCVQARIIHIDPHRQRLGLSLDLGRVKQ